MFFPDLLPSWAVDLQTWGNLPAFISDLYGSLPDGSEYKWL